MIHDIRYAVLLSAGDTHTILKDSEISAHITNCWYIYQY